MFSFWRRMRSEGACEPSVSASLCVSGGRVLACACVCARARQLYVTPALSPPQSSGPARSSRAPNPSCRGGPAPSRRAHPRTRAPGPAPSDLLHAAASYAVLAAPARWGAVGGGPSMRPVGVAAPHPATAAREERPESATQAPPAGPAPAPAARPSVHTPPAGRGTARARTPYTPHAHTPHTSRGASLPASPVLLVLGALSPEKIASKGSPSPHF